MEAAAFILVHIRNYNASSLLSKRRIISWCHGVNLDCLGLKYPCMRKNSVLLCTVCQLTKKSPVCFRFSNNKILDFIIMLLLSLFSHLFCLCRYLMAAQSQGPAVSAIPRLNINDRFGCKTFQP